MLLLLDFPCAKKEKTKSERKRTGQAAVVWTCPSPTPIHYTLFPPSLLCIFAINQEKADWDSRAGHAYLSILVWHLNSAERTVESGWSSQRRRTFLSHNFGGAPSAPPTFVGQRLRIYFLILLTRHENIQNAIVPTSTMHSTNSPCSVCGSCFCVLTCVRLMLISSGATLARGGGVVLRGWPGPQDLRSCKKRNAKWKVKLCDALARLWSWSSSVRIGENQNPNPNILHPAFYLPIP